jgi:hypothetical protein
MAKSGGFSPTSTATDPPVTCRPAKFRPVFSATRSEEATVVLPSPVRAVMATRATRAAGMPSISSSTGLKSFRNARAV